MSEKSARHSKKRNAGLMYEFLIRTISRALVDNDPKRSSSALRVIKTYFKPGTELHREFRLFNSLVKTTVSTDAVASSILIEAKSAARSIDIRKLEKEKTRIILEVDKTVADDSFYDQPISEYKTYATIGTLFNAWREPLKYDIGKIAQYEEKLVEWLKTKKEVVVENSNEKDSPGVNRLVFKLMTKKLNDKYGAALDPDQKTLVREYALYGLTGEDTNVRAKLVEVKNKLVSAAGIFSSDLPDHTRAKLTEAARLAKEESIDRIDDSIVSRYMAYVKLTNELETREDR